MAVHEGFSRLVCVTTDGQNPNTPEMLKEHTVQIAIPVTLPLECYCDHIVVFGLAETLERPSDFLTMTQNVVAVFLKPGDMVVHYVYFMNL